MSDRYFLDANILIYAHDRSDPRKQSIAEGLILDGIREERSVISTQVLGEFFVNATRKISQPLSEEAAARTVRALAVMPVRAVDRELVLAALDIRARDGLSWWDAQIVAAARSSRCGILYSEDLAHRMEYMGVRVVNPFLEAVLGGDNS